MISWRTHVTDTAGHLFEGLSVSQIYRVEWVSEANEQDHGVYWIARDAATPAVLWVCDGLDRIAAADDWRVARYLYRGIARRCDILLKDYLGGGVIPLPRPGRKVVNFGANIGEAAIALARRRASVLAIEMDPNVFPALNANEIVLRLYAVNACVWKENGSIPISIATRMADTSAVNLSGECVTMPAKRLDTIMDLEGWHDDDDPIDLILGDAEGAEPEVLMGAVETLKRTKYVSLRLGAERNGQDPYPECKALLETAGFDILCYENERLIGKNKCCQ
jgi:FkbM family methyltransferase